MKILMFLLTCRWRDVKLRAFDNAKHRTYVDLKVGFSFSPRYKFTTVQFAMAKYSLFMHIGRSVSLPSWISCQIVGCYFDGV